MVRYEGDAMVLHVDSPADGYLFLSDPFYPGWRAEVDGEPEEILRANYAFRALAVPAGSHTVRMVFRPSSWLAGLGISIGTGLALLILVGALLVRKTRAGRGQ
jgi:uncharacterized membrane protein YfhO